MIKALQERQQGKGLNKAMTKLDILKSILKSRDITDKGLYSQSYGFSSSHEWMWELDHKKGCRTDAIKMWCVGEDS